MIFMTGDKTRHSRQGDWKAWLSDEMVAIWLIAMTVLTLIVGKLVYWHS